MPNGTRTQSVYQHVYQFHHAVNLELFGGLWFNNDAWCLFAPGEYSSNIEIEHEMHAIWVTD